MKIFKIIIIISVLVLIAVISEMVYTYKNKPEVLFAKTPLLIASLYLQRGDLDKTVSYIDKAANYYVEQNQKAYSDKIPKAIISYTHGEIDLEAKIEFTNSLKETLPQAVNINYPSILSNVYYSLGLVAYEKGLIEQAISYFTTSIYLNPSLSLLHVELANIYLNEGRNDMAEKTIDYCLNFESPARHCGDFRDAYFQPPILHPPGFLKDTIKENLFY